MRWSKLFVPTLKEDPSSAESTSHRLLLRAGFIRPLGAGIYSLLPLAQKVRNKVIALIRKEIDGIGGQEFALPALHPQEIWESSGRLAAMGEIMFRLKDRKGAPYVLGTTHEEIFTGIASSELRSYRQLPQIWYQFQTKFRDEPRPRSGLLRVREFTMKDSYSFDLEQSGLDTAFELHRRAYCDIFRALSLPFVMVEASSGTMGGSQSVEFMLSGDCGEDTLVICDACGYAANSEKARSDRKKMKESIKAEADQPELPLEKFATPGVKTIVQLEEFKGGAPAYDQIKSLVYAEDGLLKLVLMRGDDELNVTKLQELLGANEIRPAHEEEIVTALGAHPGSLGAVGVTSARNPRISEIIADESLVGRINMVTGANEDGYHYKNVSVARDIKIDRVADIRNVESGEPCISCGKALRLCKGLEIGHIFKLGKKYSEKMGAAVLDQEGQSRAIYMGSYGIGVERLLAACVEAFSDDKGIVWPVPVAPYTVVITPVELEGEVMQVAERFYEELSARGVDVLLDDRDMRPGVKFAESELIGIPLRITLGKKLKEGKVEIVTRKGRVAEEVPVDDAVYSVLAKLDHRLS